LETEGLDYVLNLRSEEMQKKWKNANPIVQEKQLVLTLMYGEIIFVPVCSNIFSS
jgi:hypothetical protein